MHKIEIRIIRKTDNAVLAKIIRNTLTEFGCNRPGTAFADPETDFLYEQFQSQRTIYFVAELSNEIIGGAGIGLLAGFDDVCELQKMYLLPHARKKGIAQELLARCVKAAKENGFKKMYLESLRELHDALLFYEMNGFEYLNQPLSQTGHFSCDKWMLKSLD